MLIKYKLHVLLFLYNQEAGRAPCSAPQNVFQVSGTIDFERENPLSTDMPVSKDLNEDKVYLGRVRGFGHSEFDVGTFGEIYVTEGNYLKILQQYEQLGLKPVDARSLTLRAGNRFPNNLPKKWN